MLVFAWILWGIFVFAYFILFATILGGCMAMNDPTKTVRLEIKPLSFLLNIAVFVFLNLYIFCGA